jgi:hypothetical protein
MLGSLDSQVRGVPGRRSHGLSLDSPHLDWSHGCSRHGRSCGCFARPRLRHGQSHGRFAHATAGPAVARVDRPRVAHATAACCGRSHGRFARDAPVTRLLCSRRGGVGVRSNGVGVRLVATSVMSSSSVLSDHNDSNFVTSYPPLLRIPCKCINKCGKHVSQLEILAVLA